jgi:hypothetical protein
MKEMTKKTKNNIFKYFSISLILLGLFLVSKSSIPKSLSITSVANASGTGGPIVLDGMDPVCHANGENTYQYIGKVLRSVYDKSTMPSNNGKIAILGIASTTSAGGCGGDWATMLTDKFLTQFTAAPTVEFITTAAELDTFFSTLITSAPPKMIWIPDDWGRSATINSKFTTNAEKIADFVNSGGGLFSNYNTYGWLTALLPSAVFNNGGCNGGPDATADGTADFGLTNTMVAACWHGYFTGNVGTLKTLVDYPFPTGSTRKAVSIGGGSVSLPSSFTLAISPTSPNAGEDLTIIATAQTISGVPQAGVTVTITVSSGPDAGSTLTATTNSSGVATITVRTNSQGTAVYTATATVNGVAKTVSATVSWNPPVTTVPPLVTTTSTSSTTTSVLQQITTLPEVVQTTTTAYSILPLPQEVTTTTESSPVPDLGISSSPKTTVHDHSTHSHGILPETGSNSSNGIKLALFVILLGWIIMSIRGIFLDSKKSRKGA